MFYTYLHCKPDGVPFYVGKGSGGRAYELRHMRNRYHGNVVQKYGENNIGVFVFDCESETQAFEDELGQISQLRSDGYELANLVDGGKGGIRGFRHSEESKRRISVAKQGNNCGIGNKSRTGIPSSDKQKQIARLTHRGNKYNSGKSQTQASNEKRSATLKGRKFSRETLDKMSSSAKALWKKRKSTSQDREEMNTAGTRREPLYQVWAEETATGKLVVVPFFPRIAQEVAEEWAATMRAMIALGKEKRYSNPRALLHIRVPE